MNHGHETGSFVFRDVGRYGVRPKPSDVREESEYDTALDAGFRLVSVEVISGTSVRSF
jgi:hypothetical protein